jgi:membrane-bound serine protease (ClpP class)
MCLRETSCARFQSRWPRRAALLPSLAALTILCLPAAAAAAPAPVLRLRIDSPVQPVAAQVVRQALQRADREKAGAMVIEIDTPGGLLSSTHDITAAMLAARTPVVVFVAPAGARAASAGFFLLMAADVAAMAPGTNAGAAHPVGSQGENIPGTLGKKVEQDAAANMRSLAGRSGRNVTLAEAAVLDSRSFTAEEARDAKLVEIVAPSFPELLRALDGRTVRKGAAQLTLHTVGAPVETVEASAADRLLAVLAEPDLAFLLLVVGGIGLLFELTHPGAVLPGVAGAISLLLAFFALSVLPVNYAGLALIFLALALFVAEVKVASYGVLTVGGTVSLVLGALLLFQGSAPDVRVGIQTIAVLALFSASVVGFLTWRALGVRRLPVRSGREGLMRERGRAVSALAPAGKVFVHGEFWDAVSELPVGAGEEVEVVAVEDLRLVVRPPQAA